MTNMKNNIKLRPKNLSYRVLAINILKESKRPMTSNEMIKIILEKKKIDGKTPANSLRSILQRSNLFKRVGKSKYILNKNYLDLHKDDSELDMPRLF